jgi:hypothetical protein
MLDDLVQLALRNGSAALASHLGASIKQHGSAKLTAVALRMVEQASTLAAAAPSLDYQVGLWFRPLVTKRLIGEGIDTLGQLVDFLQFARWKLVALNAANRTAPCARACRLATSP